MISRIKSALDKILDLGYAKVSFAQEGEDLILERIFETQSDGFYVDVGAHHPKRFSNTYLFYKKGWKGINIDAMPNSMTLFSKIRPRDINLELGIADTAGTLAYYMFDEPALNGFDKEISTSRDNNTAYNIIRTVEITTTPLSSLLEKHVPAGQQISFLSVDVEGLDLDVLKSNNWNKFIPKLILVEILNSNTEEIFNSEIHRFLSAKNYTFYCKTPNTVFYKLQELN